MSRFLLIAAAMFPTLIRAAEETGSAVPDPLGGDSLLRLAGGMLLVLALVFGAAWLLRRLQRLQGINHGKLRVVAGLAVGQRERVLVVQVGEQQLLLGVAPGSVKKLHELPEPMTTASESETAPFARELSKLLKRGEAKA